jgi:hypothetical protein
VIENIREMMIQHILTEDIFNTIFDEPYFHRENNVARQLENIIAAFLQAASGGRCYPIFSTIFKPSMPLPQAYPTIMKSKNS